MFAAPAHADPDTDFANELHIYGIYGQKDYNAWIGKITCKRLYNGVDHDANESAQVRLSTAAEGQRHRAGVPVPGRRAAHLLPREAADPQQVRPAAAVQPTPAGPPLAAEGRNSKGSKDVW